MPSRELNQETLEKVESDTKTTTPSLIVLCEGQADCHFYSAVAAAVRSDTPSLPKAKFLDGGGKYAFPALIHKVRGRGEDVRVVADFEVLSAEMPLRDIAEALGGTWSTCYPLWHKIYCAVRTQHRTLKRGVQKPHTKDIGIRRRKVDGTPRQTMRVPPYSSPWMQAKRCGRCVVPESVRATYHTLVSTLAERGLFLVEVGELESFVPAVGHHGSRWGGKVLKRFDAATAPELEEARRFVRHVLSYRSSG